MTFLRRGGIRGSPVWLFNNAPGFNKIKMIHSTSNQHSTRYSKRSVCVVYHKVFKEQLEF